MARKHLTIPECRAALQVIAATLPPTDARRVRYVIGHMKRRPPVRTTTPKSAALTPAIKAQIRRLATLLPDASQADIGHRVGVNPGRVSEALAGKRR